MSETTQSSEKAGAEKDVAEAKLRTVTGRVVSSSMDKTVAVAIERLEKHPVYGKYIRRTGKVLAHDEKNLCQTGDTVDIAPCRPISKRKSWRVVSVATR
ncbi:MAG: 30S ribosomal protein S17 [Gammaproteobacteria bacterium]